MKKILNIRGGDGSGKTTAVWEYLKNHSFDYRSIVVGKRYKSELTVVDGGRVIICGAYDGTRGSGVDKYKGGKQLVPTIAKVIRTYYPDTVIYEGYVFSTVAGVNKKIAQMARDYGYQWVGIYLSLTLKEQESNLEERYNRTDYLDITKVEQQNEVIRRATRRMLQSGEAIRKVNISGYPKPKMAQIIEKEIG